MGCSRNAEQPSMLRPQTPKEPFSYRVEEVAFVNEDFGITLSGTLTIPTGEGRFPAVVLISGSGAQNRDEELYNHKPFMVIADYLTRNGIAVLRYDDRGVGKSEGDYMSATSYDLASDSKAAVSFLRSYPAIDTSFIGLIGHSEGGMIAAITAAEDSDIAFVVSLAGTGVIGKEISLKQTADILRITGAGKGAIRKTSELNSDIYEIIINEKDNEVAVAQVEGYLRAFFQKRLIFKKLIELQITTIMASMPPESLTWQRYFLATDPALFWKQVKCPVLALNGAKDIQVSAVENLAEIKQALYVGGNEEVTTIEIADLNHLFQTCETGNTSEYIYIEQTFSEVALQTIEEWIDTIYSNQNSYSIGF